AQASYLEVNILVGSEQAKFPEQVHQTAYTNIPEEILCGLRASASGFMYFTRSNRFGERQLRILNHAAPHQRNEVNAKNAADHNQRGCLEVSFPVREPKRRPRPGNDECRYGEDCTGGDSFANRPRSSS